MAGDWIKVEKATARKPEIFGIAGRLGISLDAAFGLCVRFWFWCDDQMTDGNAPGVTSALLNDAMGQKDFAESLIDVGWLQVRSGSLAIPHFDRHLSDSAKNRALSSKRVRKSRVSERNKCNGAGVTKALPEKRREEKSNKKENTPPNPQGGNGGELLTAQVLVNEWNVTPGVVTCRTVSEKRIKLVGVRIRDPAWDWRAALVKFPLRCFANSDRGWKPDIDWFLKPDTVLHILEGKYDWEKENGSGNERKPAKSKFEQNIDVLAEFARSDNEHGVLDRSGSSLRVEADDAVFEE